MSTANFGKIGVLRSVLELFGIIFVRFPPIPRIWVAWLVGVNAAGLLFIDHIEAQVALAAVAVVVLMQALIYQRERFIRVLGVTHILWVPMLAWIASRIPTFPSEETQFRAWAVTLIVTNAICLMIDTWDAARFVAGERKPYYVW
jgi:hypothetical protein